MYAYAANNPVKYTDPDGRFVIPFPLPILPPPIIPPPVMNNGNLIGDGFYQMPSSMNNTTFPLVPSVSRSNITVFPNTRFKQNLRLTFMLIAFKTALVLFNKAPGTDAIPDADKDAIAQHSVDGGHGPGVNFDNPTEEGVKERINDILSDPNTITKKGQRGRTLYMGEDGTSLIHDPASENKGTIFYPERVGPKRFYDNFE